MDKVMVLNIAKEYSPFVAGRFPKHGPFNGERFRRDYLVPALKKNDKVILDIDGVVGLPSSFWEESLGGLIREEKFSYDDLLKRLDIIATQENLLVYVEIGKEFLADAAKAKSIIK